MIMTIGVHNMVVVVGAQHAHATELSVVRGAAQCVARRQQYAQLQTAHTLQTLVSVGGVN